MARRELLHRVIEKHHCAVGSGIKENAADRIVRAVHSNRFRQLSLSALTLERLKKSV